MKKAVGLILLLAVMIFVGISYIAKKEEKPQTAVNGYVGGEKIGFLEDEEVQSVLQEKYGLSVDYSKAGSLDMMTADQEERNYLFPSSSIAAEYYEELHGKPVQSEIVMNTPIVLYTRKMVADALEEQGLITAQGEARYLDMKGMVQLIQEDTSWADLGLPQLYGTVSVDTTDPSRSNSGNMFAALLANVLNGGKTLTSEDVEEILPQLESIFGKLGYMEDSSADLFSQFLKMGVGAMPVIAGYESQLIEYAAGNPEEYQAMKEDLVLLYPTPTVWSSHVLIALDEKGQKLIQGLLDEEVQKLAWEKHGFRTEVSGAGEDVGISGVADSITQVTQVPEYPVMREIFAALE